ncbi:MAG TPA: hypothetical protein VH595_16430 [Verrucomicrobiae bacterium]|jgi:hypothetical protein|nr:hypothetical protein [Verrucomicrobiae bacterium]
MPKEKAPAKPIAKLIKTFTETEACAPVPIFPNAFNPKALLPYGLTTNHIKQAMEEFLAFLGFINGQLGTKSIHRLESFMMAANFSSLVGEFMSATIPRFCETLVKNRHHNGHPDLLPKDKFPRNAMQHGNQGVEIKASRYLRGWQGHNAENAWLMVFVFDSNTSQLDKETNEPQSPRPFQFVKVVGAKIAKSDWLFSGRSETSRRTITASVTRSGYEKMESNWIYRHSEGLLPRD